MGKAYQCDRCKDLDTDTPVLQVTVKSLRNPGSCKDFELCPQCLVEFHDWLDAALPVAVDEPTTNGGASE